MIGGAYDGCSGSAYDACSGGGANDAGSGSGCDACIGGGAYDGDVGGGAYDEEVADIAGGSGTAAHAGSGGGNVGERGFIEEGDDAGGAEGATDGPDRGADAGGAIDGARGLSGAFPAMRFVAGTMLIGALLTGGFLSTFVSSQAGRAPVAGGVFAAGPTPAPVVFRCAGERTTVLGREVRDPVSALGFHPSVPKTAPMRKL